MMGFSRRSHTVYSFYEEGGVTVFKPRVHCIGGANNIFKKSQFHIGDIFKRLTECLLIFRMKNHQFKNYSCRIDFWRTVEIWKSSSKTETKSYPLRIFSFIRWINAHRWGMLYQDFSTVLKPMGIKRENFIGVFNDYHEKRNFRTRIENYEAEVMKLNGRLYPLSIDRYNQFAYEVWEKRGAKKLGYQVFNGIQFGHAVTKRYGRSKSAKVYSRKFGMKIKDHKLVITCAG